MKLEHQLVPTGPGLELAMCTICNAAEGELLDSCPGFELNAETLKACYDGNIIDMKWHPVARARRRALRVEEENG